MWLPLGNGRGQNEVRGEGWRSEAGLKRWISFLKSFHGFTGLKKLFKN
jgi:hypothetical protein